MNVNNVVQGGLYVALLILLAWPLGSFMARLYEGKRTILDPVLGPLERFLYRLAGVKPEVEMKWTAYAGAMLVFNLFGFLAVYAIQRFQHLLPLNPRPRHVADGLVGTGHALFNGVLEALVRLSDQLGNLGDGHAALQISG